MANLVEYGKLFILIVTIVATIPLGIAFVKLRFSDLRIAAATFVLNLMSTIFLTGQEMEFKPFLEFNTIAWGIALVVGLIFEEGSSSKKSDNDKEKEA